MIRKFKTDDIDEVIKIWLSSNIDSHKFIEKTYWESTYSYVKKALPQADVFVYENNGSIFGFIGLSDSFIAGIFVDENSRSNGIGHKLIKQAKKIRSTLTLDVYKKNRRAVSFYLKEGFRVHSEQIDSDTGETEFTMTWAR